jgi:hypothetical protein
VRRSMGPQGHDAPCKNKSIAICDDATVDKWLAIASKRGEVECLIWVIRD